ncbi:carbohydrate ABC transporter permease [Cellulomonas sp. URHD0024]|uniref:carbohydrate ABC transporter permease n=1 Tax=Cellulomonas sp. URHD0024 TaxID=1302620 RepID=UPI00040BFED2|nr:sugar ABC transporter permease [Cellulomonas sp. URHD0024]
MTTTDPVSTTTDPTDGRSPAGHAPAGGRRRRRRTPNGPNQHGRPFWMLAPSGFLMFFVILVPLALAFYISVIDLDQYTIQHWLKAPFVGLQNYVEAINDTSLLHAVRLSVSQALLVSLITMPIGIAAALATQNAFRGRAVVRSVFLVPYILPAFVVATVWRTMMHPQGLLDHVVGSVGIDVGLWLNGPTSFWSLVLVQSWSSWPFYYLLVLAGLQSVDKEVHEASALDGALWWTKLRYVVLPYLRGSILLALVISFLHNVNAFTLPYVLFGVPAPHDVEVLPVLTYVTSFQSFRFGLSAAMAVVSLALVVVPLFLYLRAVRLDSGEDRVRR